MLAPVFCKTEESCMKTRLLRKKTGNQISPWLSLEGDYDLEKESAARESTEEEKREDVRNRCFGTF